MPFPSDYFYPSDLVLPGFGDDTPQIGTIWSLDDWTGYEGMPPILDDLGCLHFVTTLDNSTPAVDGWEGKSSPRVQSDDRPTFDGTNDGRPTQPGKTVTINGIVRAPDVPTLQQAMGRISGVLMSGDRYGTLIGAESWMSRTMRVRCGADTLVKPSRTVAKEAVYSFVLYGPSGRRLGAPVQGSTGLPSSSGGLQIPFTIPFSIDSSVISGRVVLTNPGTMTGPVVSRIDGPISGPVITHVNSGVQLVFASSLALAAGEWLIVDMERHTVLANGQESAPRNEYVLPGGRGWSGFDKGDNTWSLAAQSGGPGAGLTISAWPAWP
jgi:hypothetical protein